VTYRVRLMSSGWAPPESGPFRAEYLRFNGEAFLGGARAALAAIAVVLGPQKIPLVTLSGNHAVDLAMFGAVVQRWSDIRDKYSDVIDDDLREPIEAAVSNSLDALNFLEDTDLRETAHALVHQTALLRGCVQ
jgi:hypothetical protein